MCQKPANRPEQVVDAPWNHRLLRFFAIGLRSALTVFCLFSVGGVATADEDSEDIVLGLKCLNEEQAPESLKKSLDKVPAKKFVIVTRVAPGGPAEQAGIKVADVITRINKMPVEDLSSFRSAVKNLEAGRTVEVEGYSPFEKNGRLNWRKGKLKVTPMTRQELLFAAMKITTDEVTGETRYRHRQSPAFPGDASDLQVYLIKNPDGSVSPRLRIQYVADDWLFIRQFTLKCDATTWTITPSAARQVERDNARGAIWEWYDVPVGASEQQIIDSLLTAKRAILRSEGRQYFKDRDIESKEIDRLRTVLAVRKLLESGGAP